MSLEDLDAGHRSCSWEHGLIKEVVSSEEGNVESAATVTCAFHRTHGSMGIMADCVSRRDDVDDTKYGLLIESPWSTYV